VAYALVKHKIPSPGTKILIEPAAAGAENENTVGPVEFPSVITTVPPEAYEIVNPRRRVLFA